MALQEKGVDFTVLFLPNLSGIDSNFIHCRLYLNNQLDNNSTSAEERMGELAIHLHSFSANVASQGNLISTPLA